jgi:hypothetical protein
MEGIGKSNLTSVFGLRHWIGYSLLFNGFEVSLVAPAQPTLAAWGDQPGLSDKL